MFPYSPIPPLPANLCLPSNFLAAVPMYRLIMFAAILGDIRVQASYGAAGSKGGLIREIVASGLGELLRSSSSSWWEHEFRQAPKYFCGKLECCP